MAHVGTVELHWNSIQAESRIVDLEDEARLLLESISALLAAVKTDVNANLARIRTVSFLPEWMSNSASTQPLEDFLNSTLSSVSNCERLLAQHYSAAEKAIQDVIEAALSLYFVQSDEYQVALAASQE